QTELRNAVEKLSGDLCISRPKSRLSWGIELPFDRDYVNYVWFDALTNYISFIGYDPTLPTFDSQPLTFRNKWPALHVIGKDIMVPAHGIYWPIMLHALGFPDEQMPSLLVHGWWNISGAKMSKSLGNIVDPDVLADKYGVEALRYYLMIAITTGQDVDFSEEHLIQFYNRDLANNLGNMLSRTLSMIQKYRGRQVRRPPPNLRPPYECKSWQNYTDTMGTLAVHQCIYIAVGAAGFCNQYIEEQKPWALAKDPNQSDRLDAVLYHSAEALRISAILISPVLPKAAHGIFDQLNWKTELTAKEERFSLADAEWGKLPDGHVVGKPTPLFPRIEE
ncbi:MAG: class I tRNA ligase family protein, partial [Verrucomicrobiota bacterium]|nr:class I tRNA ligase family protein [Verrucomicrobiota bacterium]